MVIAVVAMVSCDEGNDDDDDASGGGGRRRQWRWEVAIFMAIYVYSSYHWRWYVVALLMVVVEGRGKASVSW